jgi:hypothetical protein
MARQDVQGVANGMASVGTWARATAQRYSDDVVLHAALFKPNAWGRVEMSSWRGFQTRQFLKAQGRYLGERIIVAVTPLEVFVLRLGVGRLGRSIVLRMPRAECRVSTVAPIGPMNATEELQWPAIVIGNARGCEFAELLLMHRDDEAARLLESLLAQH